MASLETFLSVFLRAKSVKEEAEIYQRELKNIAKDLKECLSDADNEAAIECVEWAQQAIENLNSAWRSLRVADEMIEELKAELSEAAAKHL